MLTRLAVLALLAISPALATEPIELYATDNGRMYSVPRDELFTAVKAAMKEERIRLGQTDSGVMLGEPRRFKKRDFEAITGMPQRALVDFHFWIAPNQAPARLYIHTIVTTDDAYYFNLGPLERWMFSAVERHLDTEPMGIPLDVKTRGEAIREMTGSRCLLDIDAKLEAGHQIQEPELIQLSKVSPWFPPSVGHRREEASVLFMANIAEDGAVHSLQVLRNRSGNKDYVASAAGAVRLWRYRPAMLDGCPIPTSSNIIFVDFSPR